MSERSGNVVENKGGWYVACGRWRRKKRGLGAGDWGLGDEGLHAADA